MSRSQTGKSSIFGMLVRMMLFFGLLGAPCIWWLNDHLVNHPTEVIFNPVTGENQLVMSDEVVRSPGVLTSGWFFGVGLVIFVGWAAMRLISAVLFHGDREYRAWRESGGDPYFDSLASPFNLDDDETPERY